MPTVFATACINWYARSLIRAHIRYSEEMSGNRYNRTMKIDHQIMSSNAITFIDSQIHLFTDHHIFYLATQPATSQTMHTLIKINFTQNNSSSDRELFYRFLMKRRSCDGSSVLLDHEPPHQLSVQFCLLLPVNFLQSRELSLGHQFIIHHSSFIYQYVNANQINLTFHNNFMPLTTVRT